MFQADENYFEVHPVTEHSNLLPQDWGLHIEFHRTGNKRFVEDN
jgi:hypothetical protein